MTIPTAHSTDSLGRFLLHMQNAPVPTQVNRAYLKEVGFKSGNDPELRHIGRLLGFLNDDDVPLDRWHRYKLEGKLVLKEAVLETYRGVFEIFQNAPERSEEELMTWFRPPITGETRSAMERAIRTFRKLCLEAGIVSELAIKKTSGHVIKNASSTLMGVAATGPGPVIIQPPNFKDEADYVRFFSALKKVFYE